MKLNKKGQSIVETALILPVIILLLMGMFEFSRIFGSYLLITYTGRESARMAAVGKNDAEIIENVHEKAGLLDLANLQVIVDPSGTRQTGQDVKINIKYKIVIYAPIIQSILPNPFYIESNTYMRVE
ncbi:MAG TPA: TadE/TadG family type IV pilus assembly protein [Methanosarcinales archaeon]|nr:TadE/TadG family type IV pilus assembly protein [Methanosarcinales archaeon]